MFRYMRACFDQNQSTRMVLAASHFIVARSKYLNLVISEPWRMKQVMNRVSKRLDSPECRYLTYCYLRLSELTVEHLKKATRGLRQREPDLVDFLHLNSCFELAQNTSLTNYLSLGICPF